MPWCQGASQHPALGRIQARKTGDDAVGVQGWGEISVRNAGTPATAPLCRLQRPSGCRSGCITAIMKGIVSVSSCHMDIWTLYRGTPVTALSHACVCVCVCVKLYTKVAATKACSCSISIM